MFARIFAAARLATNHMPVRTTLPLSAIADLLLLARDMRSGRIILDLSA